MNTVLNELLETGTTKTADGSGTIKLHSQISAAAGQLLQKIVRETDPTVSLEVGLAFGTSALFICDALRRKQGTCHITIDPFQGSALGEPHTWGGIGIANLHRAGFGDFVTLIQKPSYRALAELESSGTRIDFAFIDGWHTFDFALIDFFFIDRMLNPGGVVIFDDAAWPAVRKVCRFVNNNMNYSVLGTVDEDGKPPLKRRLAELLPRNPLQKLLRPEVTVPDRHAGIGADFIAFRKIANDERSWDHFADF